MTTPMGIRKHAAYMLTPAGQAVTNFAWLLWLADIAAGVYAAGVRY